MRWDVKESNSSSCCCVIAEYKEKELVLIYGKANKCYTVFNAAF